MTAEQTPLPQELGEVLSRNIRALVEARAAFDRRKTTQQRIADAITRFTGSMAFVWAHAVAVTVWLVFNAGVIAMVRAWDPFPFVMLAMIASVEAIFLSTFVLISQNRASEAADRRAELDLQINLLAEHEVTKLIAVVDRIADRLGVDLTERASLQPLAADVEPEKVLAELERAAEASRKDAATHLPEERSSPSSVTTRGARREPR
jgi:uncharacterized membrane protein